MNTTKKLLLALTLIASASSASATIITVDGEATGGFGSPNTGYQAMVAAHTFGAGGGSIDLSATGIVGLAGPGNPGFDAGPDGIPINFGYSPLQEAAIDAGGPTGQTDNQYGALMGIFVLDSVVNTPGFQAIDEDLTAVGLDADALFLVGSNYNFSTGVAGTLFLGVNDSYAEGNHGDFTVEINAATSVPVSGTVALLTIGWLGLRRQTKSMR